MRPSTEIKKSTFLRLSVAILGPGGLGTSAHGRPGRTLLRRQGSSRAVHACRAVFSGVTSRPGTAPRLRLRPAEGGPAVMCHDNRQADTFNSTDSTSDPEF